MRRRLIINADDLGLTTGINLGVCECADAGLVRSSTLMANGPAFDDAVNRVKGREGFGTGIHFVLTGLKPVAPAQKLGGLLGPEGLLPAGPIGLLGKIEADKSLRNAVRCELFAQAEKIFDSGITPTHFDCHKHVHIIPAVLDSMVEIAARFSVKWVREPFEPNGSWRLSRDLEKDLVPKFLKQFSLARASLLARPAFRSCVRRAGLQTPAGVYGISFTGLMSEDILKRLCGILPPGLSELMTHPGIVDAELIGCNSRLLYSRAREKDLLVSARVKGFFEESGIVLSHFGVADNER